jgi:hypothetical protein
MIRLSRWVALVSIAGLDAIAVAALFAARSRGVALLAGAGGHMALCLASTWTMFAGKSPWADGGPRLRALACAIAFFMPVLGGPGLLVALSSAFSGRPAEEPKWRTVPIDGARSRGAGRGGSRPALGRIAGLLRTRTPETNATRFRAVLEVPRFKARESAAILRACLDDPFDEVRLYAFARLERLRDDIESTTRRLTKSLPAAASHELATLHLRIAESHWEACYLGLVEGVVLEDAMASARQHAKEALRLRPRDAAASFLLGRVQLRSSNYLDAVAQFEMALDAGFPAIRALPYLAEAHFAQRHYSSVKVLMRDLAGLPGVQALPGGVMEFWR